MLPSLIKLIPWFIKYKYWVIFPIAVVEGPIITIITGFLASMGYLGLVAGFLTVSIGDLVGDSLTYWIGRLGRERFVRRYGKYFGLTWARVEKLEHYFEKHSRATFLFGKFMHGSGYVTWFATGIARVPFGRFLGFNTITTAIKSTILILIGYYFGRAYMTFDSVLSKISLIVFALFVVVYITAINTNLLDKFWKRLEE